MSGFASSNTTAPVTARLIKLRLRTWVWELILTCCVLLLLLAVAAPLAKNDRPYGLDQRYAPAAETSLPDAANKQNFLPALLATLSFAPFEHSKALRAQWLNRHAGAVLAILASCGWLALQLGRSSATPRIKLSLSAALWALAAHWLASLSARWPLAAQTKLLASLPDLFSLWLCAAALFILIALMVLILSLRATVRTRHHRTPLHWQFKHTAASPWVYPGLVLFSGLGWLWLLDWAARGHLDQQFSGIYQIDALWLAFTIFSLVAACQGPLLAALSRIISALERHGKRWLNMPDVLMLALLLAWLATVVALGHFNATTVAGIQQEHAANVPGQLKNYQRHAALLAQFMQVPVWLASGWVVYRWIENGQRTRQGVVMLGILLGALLLGLKSNHDGGAVLAQSIAAIWIGCGLMQRALARRLGWLMSIACSSLAALLASAGALWLGFIHAPMNRIRAMAIDYQGPLDFLSVIHWLLDASPFSGFGIGNTPWCGYAHVAGLLTQCRRAGVPGQMQSDYVSFALLALWGWPATLLILTALLFWLWELMRTGPAIESGALDFALMRQWLVTGFAVTSGVHIMISTAGTLGMMPLTGIALPMLSLGAAGLVSTAIFAGLSVNRIEFNAPIERNDKNKETA